MIGSATPLADRAPSPRRNWPSGNFDRAKLGQDDRLAAIARLDSECRRLGRTATGPTLDAYVAEERRRPPEYSERSILGWEQVDRGAPSRSARVQRG